MKADAIFAITDFNEASVAVWEQSFDAAFHEGNYEAMTAAYTQDAKLMNQDSALIQGREAIRAFWKVACERAKSVEMKRSRRTEEFDSSGHLAYKRTSLTLEIPAPGGETVVHRQIHHRLETASGWCVAGGSRHFQPRRSTGPSAVHVRRRA